MIVFDLECRAGGHRFEGWFASTDEFERQRQADLLACPICGSADVAKAVMAPRIGRKGNQLPDRPRATPDAVIPAEVPPPVVSNTPAPMPPEAAAMFRAIAMAQAEALKSSRWVGGNFAEEARAMHYGERDPALIHGQTTPDEARELLEEGVPVAPLLIPVVPPDQAN